MQLLVSYSLAGKGKSAVHNEEPLGRRIPAHGNTDIQHIPEFGST